MQETVTIPLPKRGHITALVDIPEEYTEGTGLVLAHGITNDLDGPDIAAVARATVERGIPTMRFRFPFKERGEAKPDPIPKLQEAYRRAVAWMRERFEVPDGGMVLGGRSIGARIASLTATAGEPAAGLLLLAYPLHRPGDRESLRDTHLYVIHRPMLFVSGTRDDYCDLELLRQVLARLGPDANLLPMEGLDHGFRKPGEPEPSFSTLARIAHTTSHWTQELLASSRPHGL